MVGVKHLHPKTYSTEPIAEINHEKAGQRCNKVQCGSYMRRSLLRTSTRKDMNKNACLNLRGYETSLVTSRMIWSATLTKWNQSEYGSVLAWSIRDQKFPFNIQDVVHNEARQKTRRTKPWRLWLLRQQHLYLRRPTIFLKSTRQTSHVPVRVWVRK